MTYLKLRGPLPPKRPVPISQRICQGIIVAVLIAGIILCAIYAPLVLLGTFGLVLGVFVLMTAVDGPPWSW
jgi:hypothetical protein